MYEPPCLESDLDTIGEICMLINWLFNNIKEISVILMCIVIECYKSLPFKMSRICFKIIWAGGDGWFK